MSSIPEEVVRRYALKKGLSLAESDSLFSELEAFLDTASHRSASPTPRVDSAWHEFILHTQIYAAYCSSRYGHFVHHVPLSPVLQGGIPEEDEKKKGDRCESAVTSLPSEENLIPLFLGQCDSGTCASDCRSRSGNEPPLLTQHEVPLLTQREGSLSEVSL